MCVVLHDRFLYQVNVSEIVRALYHLFETISPLFEPYIHIECVGSVPYI